MKNMLKAFCVVAVLGFVSFASASPPVGVTASVLSRGSYDPFSVKTDHDSPVDFQAKGKAPLDIVGAPARDVSVILAPVGLAFRAELTAPGPHCSF